MAPTTYLVTGAAGFIGFNFARHVLAHTPDAQVVGLDRLTYAGQPASTARLSDEPRFALVEGDIADGELVRALLAERRPDAMVHFAAETHVDRSISGPEAFVRTNVTGTFTLLDAVRRLRDRLPEGFRFLHISTDEVYGALGTSGAFDEDTPYRPSSPYAASKAASDHFARAYHRTYDVPAIVTHCGNNFGPFQHPEKLIPRMITRALAGATLPVFGRGEQIRDWIHVEDHCRALALVLARGRVGQTYAIGARCERRNVDVVRALCAALDRRRPRPDGTRYETLIAEVDDRPGHDYRYAIDPAKITAELGWRPRVPFADGLAGTVDWYLANEGWTRAALARAEAERGTP